MVVIKLKKYLCCVCAMLCMDKMATFSLSDTEIIYTKKILLAVTYAQGLKERDAFDKLLSPAVFVVVNVICEINILYKFVCACVRACVRACMRACVRASV